MSAPSLSVRLADMQLSPEVREQADFASRLAEELITKAAKGEFVSGESDELRRALFRIAAAVRFQRQDPLHNAFQHTPRCTTFRCYD